MAHTMPMGASAVVVSLRRAVERGPVVGQTDDTLVAGVRAGDDAAFEAIYDRYARGVLAFCVQMLGSREEAEDALQLTFVSAYRGMQRSRSEISLRPWLYTIARNRCLSELRVRRDAVDADGVVVDRPSFDGLADQVQRREDLREVVEDMQRLPDDQRAALVLFELGDHSHNEIAAVLGVRPEKVKALIFQAREGLLRGRHARHRPCAEIRELLATVDRKVLPRSMARAHIDRCANCAAFEDEVARQRTALALILPVALSGELKGSVLAAAFGGGAGAAAASGVAGGSGAAATALVAGTPSVAVVATGLAAAGAATLRFGGGDAARVVAKLLTAAAIATGAATASQGGSDAVHHRPGPASIHQTSSAGRAPALTTGSAHGRPSAPAATAGGITPSGSPLSAGAGVARPGTVTTTGSPALAGAGLSLTAAGSPGTAPPGAAGSQIGAPGVSGSGGQPSSSPGQSGVAHGGPPSTSPGQSGIAHGRPALSPPGQSGIAHSGPPSTPPGQANGTSPGPPSTPPGQSGGAQTGASSNAPGQSGVAHGGPPPTPPGQANGTTSGPPSTPPGESNPGNAGNGNNGNGSSDPSGQGHGQPGSMP